MRTQSGDMRSAEAEEALAVVPLKILSQAKSRLAPAFDSQERREFVLSMLKDVLNTLRDSELVTRIFLVTRQEDIGLKLDVTGIDILADSADTNLNSALRVATSFVRNHHGERPLIIIPGDVPLITESDIHGILTLAEQVDPPLVVAASSDNGGTSALLRKPPDAIDVQFGLSSFRNHQDVAKNKGIAFLEYQSPTLALDIDTPDDLQALLNYQADNATTQYLHQSRAIQTLRRKQ
jgi:2-phospho-L-lactate guanylyltransferase